MAGHLSTARLDNHKPKTDSAGQERKHKNHIENPLPLAPFVPFWNYSTENRNVLSEPVYQGFNASIQAFGITANASAIDGKLGSSANAPSSLSYRGIICISSLAPQTGYSTTDDMTHQRASGMQTGRISRRSGRMRSMSAEYLVEHAPVCFARNEHITYSGVLVLLDGGVAPRR
jgi:hypothetical protein